LFNRRRDARPLADVADQEKHRHGYRQEDYRRRGRDEPRGPRIALQKPRNVDTAARVAPAVDVEAKLHLTAAVVTRLEIDLWVTIRGQLSA
jgi:hypothetical protein